MGRSKRKRGDPNGPSILPLAPAAVSLAETPIKAPTGVQETAAKTPKSTLKVGTPQLPTVLASQSLRQYTATSHQAQQFSGNHAGFLKVQYLAKVAEWAATTVPNLAAFLGQRLAAASEALAIPPPTPHPLCYRCETVLQVGENCSVRVTKAPKKWRKAKARGVDGGVKSALVYHCHFCKFGNKKPGTARGHVKTKLSRFSAPSQLKKLASSKAAIPTATGTPAISQRTKGEGSSKNPAATPVTAQSKTAGNNTTPAASPQVGNVARGAAISSPTGAALSPVAFTSSSPNSVAQASGSGKKRKRKGWSTLKEIATAQSKLPTPSRLRFMTPQDPDKKG